MKKVLIGILVVLLLCAGWIFGSYNGLVSANENVNGKWSQVETQLQRRSDLIPNLVNTVKGYSAHESQVFTDVATPGPNWPVPRMLPIRPKPAVNCLVP